MAVDTHEVKELVDFAPEGFLVTSFFLNVDATEFPSPDLLRTSFDSLIHEAEDKRKEVEANLSHEAVESLRSDLEKIRSFMDEDLDRQDTKGVAIISCSGQDFWQVIQMPFPVQNRVEFRQHPVVSPIAIFLSNTKVTAILVTDRQHARIFTMKEGDVREWTDFEDYVPQKSAQGGWSQQRYQRRSDNWARHHVDKAAELALRLLQNYPFDWLVLGTEVQVEADIKSDMHPYLKDRVIGEIHVRVDADAAEIVEQARQVRDEAQGRLVDERIEQIQEYAGANGRGTIGLEATLQALNEQKVHILLVQEGYSAPGSVCPNCGLLLASRPDTCPACSEHPTPVDDIVDNAIQKAYEDGSEVEVATEQGKLEPIQNIGSIMYY